MFCKHLLPILLFIFSMKFVMIVATYIMNFQRNFSTYHGDSLLSWLNLKNIVFIIPLTKSLIDIKAILITKTLKSNTLVYKNV